jgi:hypothetical protein
LSECAGGADGRASWRAGGAVTRQHDVDGLKCLQMESQAITAQNRLQKLGIHSTSLDVSNINNAFKLTITNPCIQDIYSI